jgi:protein CpxP
MRKSAWKGVPVLAVLLAVSVGSPVLQAQQGMGSAGDAGEAMAKLQKMSAELQLTPQQKEQIRPILMQEAPRMKSLKENTTMPKMQKARMMREISSETDAKMKPILNPEQYTKWEQMRAEERQQMMQKMENR